jgi:predicted CXXCH cytochrome family protein
MPRKVSWGTPGRSAHYILPRPKYALVRPSLILGGGLLAAVAILWIVGVRRPVSPGTVISAHGTVETSCQACHAPRQGASNVRCQRCHDPATAGRLDNRSHVLFGSGDVKQAAASPALECASCHVEHRGRNARLTEIDQRQCVSCHFRSFKGHPEFAVLRTPTRELPGMKFGHGAATPGFKGHVAEVMQKKGLSLAQSCATCHEPSGRDFQPIEFDRHCVECHAKDMQATVGIPEADVLAPEAFNDAELGSRPLDDAEFEMARGRVAKTVVGHKDDWIVGNLRRLRRELEPDAHAMQRAGLQARLSRLRRRLALSTPLAALGDEDLKAREAMIEAEIKGLAQRLQGQAQPGAATGGGRVDEVVSAVLAAAADDALRFEATQIKTEADAQRAVAGTAALAPQEFEARRRATLALLDAVETSDPALRARTEDLRRRLVALVPGEVPAEVLGRARDQREAELARLRDERVLRGSGAFPPASALLIGEQRALQTAVAEVEVQLQTLDQGPPVGVALTDDDRARKRDSVDSLVASCVKCHVVSGAAFAPVRAARPVLVRSQFVHQPHLLQADCVRCHAGIEASKVSSDLNFRGVQSCQECHTTRAARQDCLSCHRYHPPAVP